MEAIVFDFGKVIGFFDHGRALQKLARHTDMSPAEMLATVYSGSLEDAFESGRISSEEFLAQMHRLCRLRCSKDELATVFVDIFWPNEDVCALLPQLRGRYKLLLGSNTNELHARHFRRQFADVLGNFETLVLSHEIGERKPHAGFYEHCVRRAGCAPSQCVFIDDLPANVAGARAFGLHGVVYQGIADLCQQLKSLGVQPAPESAGQFL